MMITSIEIAGKGLGEKKHSFKSSVYQNFPTRRKNPIYGNTLYGHFVLVFICRIGWECGFHTLRTSFAIFCSLFTSATSDVVGVSVGSGGGEWLTYTFGRSVVGFGVTMASLCVRQRLQQHLTQQSAQQA